MRSRPLVISGLLALAAIVAVAVLSHPCNLAPNPPSPSPEPQDGGTADDSAGSADPDSGSGG